MFTVPLRDTKIVFRLVPFGGLTTFDAPRSRCNEILIVLGGVTANVVAALGCALLSWLGVARALFFIVGVINALSVLNLVPVARTRHSPVGTDGWRLVQILRGRSTRLSTSSRR
jgi:hypothetical protein